MATMPISPTSHSQTASSSSTGSPNQITGISANEGTFLTLLVSQLKNQDPLNPTDSTQFVSELAQFSSLEQLININQGVTTISGVVAPGTAGATSGSTTSANSSGSSTPSASQIDSSLDSTLLNSIG